MLVIFSILAFVALFGLSFFSFMMIPMKKKKFQWVFSGILLGFMLVMFIMPSSVICSIHLPVINSTIDEFAVDFLNRSNDFKVLYDIPYIVQSIILVIKLSISKKKNIVAKIISMLDFGFIHSLSY